MSLLLLLRGEEGVAPEPASTARVVREPPPLWHAVRVVPPGAARSYRWGRGESDPSNRISGLSFSSSVPGGFEQMGCTLPRLPGIDYPDLPPLSYVWVYGAGGEVRWEGRLTDAPAVSGDRMAVTPQAVGHRAHLEDTRASMVFVDRDLSRWTGPGAQRRLNLIAANIPHQGDASASWDADVNAPALALAVNGAWSSPLLPRCEAWYDAGPGNTIARIAGSFAGDPNTAFQLVASVDIDAVATREESSADLYTATSGAFTFSPDARYRYGFLTWHYNATAAGIDGASFMCKVTSLAVFGDHGLTLRTDSDGNAGYFASDVVRFAVQRWAPQLRVTDESIQQSGFVISQLREGTTVQAMIDEATRFELLDCNVWDDRTVWLHPPGGGRAKTWIARTGPSKLKQAGRSDQRLFNRVKVQWPDVDGTTRTAGPPGSGCDVEDEALVDADPENEANKLGIERYAPDLELPQVSVSGAAIELCRRFLELARQLDRSGSAEHVGTIFDDRGIEHPVSAMRAGDFVRYVDAHDTSPRRIVRATYDEETVTMSVDHDGPPDWMEAALARLGLTAVNIG